MCRLRAETSIQQPTRTAAVNVKAAAAADNADETDESTGGADYGETVYTAACEQLHINRVQRVIDGLSTPALNLKYRCLGPLGAKALSAALSVSITPDDTPSSSLAFYSPSSTDKAAHTEWAKNWHKVFICH